MLYSPYLRAQQTAQAVLARIDADSLARVVADERHRVVKAGATSSCACAACSTPSRANTGANAC
ncbi:hypothetical protein [Janthinobacterium sp. RB2P8]|uniref:hypothetical protein n=1 Tax=Janthinobacterium sp. RB2P8 TaxID=3424191 RepID=UPI003F1F34DA